MYSEMGEYIEKLSKSLTSGVNELGEEYEAVQLLPELKIDYPTELLEDIISVRFYQTEKDCYLEITTGEKPKTEPGFIYVINKRSSLSFVDDGDGPFFNPTTPVVVNAYLFLVEFDDISKLNCTDLFSKKGQKKIAERQ